MPPRWRARIRARPHAILDLTHIPEQQEWEAAWSGRAGVEIAHWRHEEHPPRLFALLGEFYRGPSPYGQFFREDISYAGIGLHFSLR